MRIKGTALALSVLVLILCSSSPGAVKGDAELLRLAATALKANKENIRTWKGRARVFKSDVYKSGDTLTSDAAVEFAADGGMKAKRWNFTWGQQYSKEGAVEKTVDIGIFKNTMLRDGTFFRVKHQKSQQHPFSCILQDAASVHADLHLFSDDFDPFFFFDGSKNDIAESMERYYKNRDSDKFNVTVSTVDGLIVVTREMDGASWRYEIDPASGYNVVRSLSKTANMTWTVSTEYEKIGDVYVPKKFLHEMEELNAEDHMKDCKSQWEVVFSNDLVNRELSSEEFSLAALGLQPGDRIHDQRTLTRYEYTGQDPPAVGLDPGAGKELADIAKLALDDTLTPTPAETASEVTPVDAGAADGDTLGQGHSTDLKYWMIAAVAVAAAVAVLLACRRKKRPGK